MVWAEPVKDAVRRILEEDVRRYEGVLYHLRQREAFAPACDQFTAEQAPSGRLYRRSPGMI